MMNILFNCWRTYEDIIPNLYINAYEDYNKNYKDKVSLQKYSEIREQLKIKNEHEQLVREWNNILPKEKFDKMIEDMTIQFINNYKPSSNINFVFDITEYTKNQLPSFISDKIKSAFIQNLKKYNIYYNQIFLCDEPYDKHNIVITNNTWYGF